MVFTQDAFLGSKTYEAKQNGQKTQDAIWPVKMDYLYLEMPSYKCWEDVQRCTAEYT